MAPPCVPTAGSSPIRFERYPLSPCGRGWIECACAFETGEGLVQPRVCSLIETPHPVLRATFSHKGRRKGRVTLEFPYSKGICARILAARCARGVHQFHPSQKRRAQGKPGADCTRGRAHKTHEWTTGEPDHPAFPARWLCGLYVISPVSPALLPPSPCGYQMHARPGWAGCISTRLDASMGASGPHDFAVRACLAKALAGPRASRQVLAKAV